MRAQLCIKNLRLEALIGIHAWEQTQKQSLYLNVSCAVNIDKAAARDHIDDALDYQQLADEITRLVAKTHFQLIETMARCIAEYLQQQQGVTQGRIELIKPGALTQADSVSIILDW